MAISVVVGYVSSFLESRGIIHVPALSYFLVFRSTSHSHLAFRFSYHGADGTLVHIATGTFAHEYIERLPWLLAYCWEPKSALAYRRNPGRWIIRTAIALVCGAEDSGDCLVFPVSGLHLEPLKYQNGDASTKEAFMNKKYSEDEDALIVEEIQSFSRRRERPENHSDRDCCYCAQISLIGFLIATFRSMLTFRRGLDGIPAALGVILLGSYLSFIIPLIRIRRMDQNILKFKRRRSEMPNLINGYIRNSQQ